MIGDFPIDWKIRTALWTSRTVLSGPVTRMKLNLLDASLSLSLSGFPT
jgi:hypothetical protein